MNEPPFQFGQEVYVAWCDSWCRVDVPCRVCAGKRQVTLILGDGTHQPVECEACGKGFGGPTGVESVYEVRSGVEAAKVTGLTWSAGEWDVQTDACRSGGEIFADRGAAEALRAEQHADGLKRAEEVNRRNFERSAKQHAWSVRYHRERIERAEKEAQYHLGKLLESPGRRPRRFRDDRYVRGVLDALEQVEGTPLALSNPYDKGASIVIGGELLALRKAIAARVKALNPEVR